MNLLHFPSHFFFFVTFLISKASAVSSNGGALFIFGDSSVDTGNNFYLIPLSPANFKPYGQNAFRHSPTGRFSDGRVIVDYIAELANLPLIPPFLEPSADFSRGANFASGSAVVIPDPDQQTLVMDLPVQLKNFEEVKKSLRVKVGEKGANEIVEKAVYLISIGSNDYMVNYLADPKMQEMYEPDVFVSMVVGNLTNAIKELYAKGARKFAIVSLSPLGCIPAVRAMNPNRNDHGCFEAASSLALAHNHAMQTSLAIMAQSLKFFHYSNPNGSYNWFNTRLNQPSKYGYKDGINACCGSGKYGGNYNCGDNTTEFKLCENADDHIWWDAFHPTQRLHQQFANALWNQLPSFGLRSYTLQNLFFQNPRSDCLIICH